MNKLLLLVVCFFVAYTHATIQISPELAHFKQFTEKYNKVYASDEEWNTRFNNFKVSLKKIEELNKESHAVHEVTEYSDLSAEEFSKRSCGGVMTGRLKGNFPSVSDVVVMDPKDLPTEVDWVAKGAVTPVKNQGACGSCWAFSTIGNIEGMWFNAGNKLVSLSEAEIVDCTTTSKGCGGGWPFWAMSDILKAPYNGQIDTEESYPYTNVGTKCKFPKTVGATITNYTSYCNEQTTPCTELAMQTLLATAGPLSICLNAGPMQFYKSGVSNPTTCDPSDIDHCVLLVGYGVDETSKLPYWKIKNSWGTTFGEKGYYRLIRGAKGDQPKGKCGINTAVTVAEVQKKSL